MSARRQSPPKSSKKRPRAAPLKRAPEQGLLSAAEACQFLQIKAQTLYAYVSRGQLHPETRVGHSGHFYAQEELEVLRARSRARAGHGPAAAGSMRWGDPILESAITCIQDGMTYYRGHALSDLLARPVAFENVAELLWSGALPGPDVTWPNAEAEPDGQSPGRPLAGAPRALRKAESAAWVSRRLLLRVSEVAFCDSAANFASGELMDECLRRARSLIVAGAAELFGTASSETAKIGLADAIATALALENYPEAKLAIDAALIASADHELNASTFATRVAASTGADLYACILAGVAAFSGRYHGLSPVATYDFVATIKRPEDAEKILTAALRADSGSSQSAPTLPGFGHRLYPHGDPRAALLIERAETLMQRLAGASRFHGEILAALVGAAKKHGVQPPNLDLGLVATALALGLPNVGASSLFVTGRMAGWTAHILEQRQQGFLLRPRAKYIGRPPIGKKLR